MNAYDLAVFQPHKMLTNLSRWLDKAEQHAKSVGFDPDVLLVARLAPDQFNLMRQIQSACDAAKLLAARLAGVEAPKHPDEEKTLAEIRARLSTVIDYLDGFERNAFDDAATRAIKLGFLPGKQLTGADYMMEFALPNFYFHVTTAYAILRHNGVALGKTDFIGSLRLEDES